MVGWRYGGTRCDVCGAAVLCWSLLSFACCCVLVPRAPLCLAAVSLLSRCCCAPSSRTSVVHSLHTHHSSTSQPQHVATQGSSSGLHSNPSDSLIHHITTSIACVHTICR